MPLPPLTESKTSPSDGWRLENTYAQLPHVFYKATKATPVSAPQLVYLNTALASELGLNVDPEDAQKADRWAQWGSGNALPPEAFPIAQAYAGHQFGHFNRLGDGRALLLGEQCTPHGGRIDIQLKGSGPTPYSRNGDGRAALGPMLREVLISEAMHAMGIPTTRALMVVTTGETVRRDRPLQGAILTRTASSHIRVGTFEYAAAFTSLQDQKKLLSYALARHAPHLHETEDPALEWLNHCMAQQAKLVAQWMSVHFIHGVMNTDNVALSGETLDYGPCAFMDTYDPATVFSSIDRHGRYAYQNQPHIMHINMAILAQALLPLMIGSPQQALEKAQNAVNDFKSLYQKQAHQHFLAKLGLKIINEQNIRLTEDLASLMHTNNLDATATYADLTQSLSLTTKSPRELPLCLHTWQERWHKALAQEHPAPSQAVPLMKLANPRIIPRNQYVETALSAAEDGNMQPFNSLLKAVQTPSAETEDQSWAAEIPAPWSQAYRTFCGT